jgi:hypothetical protein
VRKKYINLLYNRLRNFKRKSSELYNFSCHLCDDSASNKKKARAYIYEKKGKTQFFCHNCNVNHTFEYFLKEIDFQLHSQYLLEKLREQKTSEQIDLENFVGKMKKPVFMKFGPLVGLKKISQLDSDDPVKKLVIKRKIPNIYHSKLFRCPKFFSWTNTMIPGKFDDEALLYDECRLLIPFFNKQNEMFAYQGRSLNSLSKTKYITIMLDNNQTKVWGIDTINLNKKTYVLEGPIDAMFLPNAIATAGGDLVSTIKDLPKTNMVIVYDNEKRSHETNKKLEKAIMNGIY